MRKLAAYIYNKDQSGVELWARVLWFSLYFRYNPALAKLLRRHYWIYFAGRIVPYAHWGR